LASAARVTPSRRLALAKFFWVGLTSFGAGRWVYLHDTFVRPGWIDNRTFMRDYAVSEVLPGPSFVNLVFLCGLRIGGMAMAIAGLVVLMLPGTVMIVAALSLLSFNEAGLAGALHGILVGAVAGLFSAFVRLAGLGMTRADKGFAMAVLVASLAGVPLVIIVAVVLLLGMRVYSQPRPMQSVDPEPSA
jgi:chromate transporter